MKHILLFSLLIFSLPSMAVDENGYYFAISSPGCGEWIEFREAKDLQAEAWVKGYLVAYNLSRKNNYNILGDTSLSTAYLWMDIWCKDNLLDGVVQGMELLTLALWPNRTTTDPQPPPE